MDQLTSDKEARDVLKQMETYQFDMPLKVSLIIDDLDLDDKTSHHGTLNVGSQDSPLSEMAKIESTNISRFNDICIDSMKKNNNHQPFLHTKAMATKSSLLTQLDTLCLDLIRLLEFEKDTSSNYNYDIKMYEKARENYLRYKVNIFNKSYDNISYLIVRLEKNYSFMTTFIKRTLAIARRCSSCAISKKMIENILSDLIQWRQVNKVNTRKNLKHKESHCIYRDIPHQVEEKSANVDLPTYKRHLFDNFVTEGKGILPLKRQKIMRTYSENNFADFNYVSVLDNEVGSQRRDYLESDPTVYLTPESGDNAIRSPSCISEPYDGMVFKAQNGSEIITSSKRNHTITCNEALKTSDILTRQCSACKNLTISTCLGCDKIYYCSVECQNSGWPTHKDFCRR